jgi:hypothetical protein
MESDLKTRMLAGNPLLAGLAERFGTNAVYDGVYAVFQFHPNLVNSVSEAGRVAEFLEQNN